MTYKERRNAPKAEGSHRYTFIANAAMTKRLEAIFLQRGGSKSRTLRMLLYLGMEAFEINGKAGVNTGNRRKEKAAIGKAQAEAIAAERNAAKQRKHGGSTVTPAASAILIDDIERETPNAEG